MTDGDRVLRDARFRDFLHRRSRMRWGFTCLLVSVYLGWALTGLYVPEIYGRGFLGSVFPLGMVLGYLIITLSISSSLLYVWLVNRTQAPEHDRRD